MRSKLSILLFGILAIILVSPVGCGQMENVTSIKNEDTIVVMGHELSLNQSMTIDEVRSMLGSPEKTVIGYFFRDDLATDYYDSENVLVRFSIPHDPQYIPTYEVVSILVLGGESKTKNGIKIGDSVENVFSVLGKKEKVGYRSEETLYLDYGVIFYYDPVDNRIKRFTLPSRWGSFD